jgi:predicted dehydrogenase
MKSTHSEVRKFREVNPLKFMIAGLGSIGRRHLRNLLALGERDILLYRTHRSTLPDDELAAFQVETNLEKALSFQPYAVIITNPTACHLDVAIPAAKAGCHLLLEKPITYQTDSRVEDLTKIVNNNNLKTLIGFQFRFHPVLSQVRELIQSGTLGRPLSFRVHWGEYLPRWHPWEDYRQSYAARKDLGGGVVNTLCHPLDYVRWLFGEVTALSATTGHVSDLDLDVEDIAEITLEFGDNLFGSIHLDYFQRPPSHWLTINFEDGQIRWENSSGIAQVIRASSDSEEMFSPPVGFERNDLFLDEMRHFLALIWGQEKSRCPLSDGIKALELTQSIHRSSHTGQKILV